ncbi:MAG: VOC family protein [Sphingobacteriaceae bacterium]|nr:MAG: VOC family protein [Sphingobacteriaceae bacterium]
MERSFTITCLGLMLLSISFTGYAQILGSRPQANHQALCVKDVKASEQFYSEVLQLEKMESPFNGSSIRWLKTGPSTELHLIQGDCSGAIHFRNVHMSYRVASLDDFMKHLDKFNIKYDSSAGPKKVQVRGDGVKQIYFQDPDGYWIEINDAK